MEVIMYTTHCPKCKIIEKKLNEKGINYQEITDVDLMIEKGFTNVPMLEVDGEIFNYVDAINWIKNK